MTYSISPDLPAGLTFGASSRTITGAPMTGTESVTYTYTATDEDGDTATLDFKITVYDLSLVVVTVNSETKADEDNSLVGFKWPGILGSSKLKVIDANENKDVEAKVTIPASTGFQIGTDKLKSACDWNAEPPASTTKYKTAWVDLQFEPFYLVRCGRGTDNSVGIRINFKEKGTPGLGYTTSTINVTIQQARHYRDNNVTYYIRGTTFKQGQMAEGIQGISTQTVEGLFEASGIPDQVNRPDPAPNTILLLAATYSAAAQAWDNVGSGAIFTRIDAGTGADVMIQGFRDTQIGKGTGQHCGESIACMQPGSSHPHLASGRVMYIEDPPHWGGHTDAKIWTNDFDEWLDDKPNYEYLPKTLMHEFGHALGLGHSPKGDVMSGGVPLCGPKPNRTFCGLTANDKNAVKEIYRGHTAH